MSNAIKLHVTRDESFDYEPSDPAGYYYMFTGGYAYATGQVTEEPPDDETADELKFAQETDRFVIELEDDTDQDFRIVRWRPNDGQLDDATLDPPPDTELEPTRSLAIEVSDPPAGYDAERFSDFTLTVQNEDGERIELNSRRHGEEH